MCCKKWCGLLVLISMFLLVACSEEVVPEPMDEVSLQLLWKHQAQFAGFYAAELNGFYRDENIKIDIRPRMSKEFDVIDSVVVGAADFGINYGVGIVEARSRKMPIIAIASIYQRDPLSFISLRKKGIKRPIDFVGRNFAVISKGGASVLFDILLKKYNIAKKDIRFTWTGYDLNRLFSGEIDVWAGYTINEVLLAQEKGIAINQMKPEDFGITMMGDTLFTSDILYNTNPDLVQRFVRATVRGWQWAVAHPEAVGKMVLHYDSTLQVSHQIAMMKASIPYIQSADTPVGMMTRTVWQEIHDSLLGIGVLKKSLDIGGLYTNDFVENVYRGQ